MHASLAAILCIIARALLHVSDRNLFQKPDSNVLMALFYNSLFPFAVSIFVCYLQNVSISAMQALVFTPAAFFAALGSQFAAITFSFSLREMRVQQVAIATKLADIFIPLLLFVMTMRFSGSSCLLSVASVLVFLPSIISSIRKREQLRMKMIFWIVIAVLLQAGINDYFQTRTLTQEWEDFLSFMVAVLFWRAMLGLILLVPSLKTNSFLATSQKTVAFLMCRAFLAFVAQASFFFAITRPSNELVWPLLNGAPLASCFAAYFCLGEPIQGADKSSLALFSLLIVIQLTFLMR